MDPVMIKCPETGELILAGYTAEDRDDLKPLNTLLECLACGGEHVWVPSEAVVIELTTA